MAKKKAAKKKVTKKSTASKKKTKKTAKKSTASKKKVAKKKVAKKKSTVSKKKASKKTAKKKAAKKVTKKKVAKKTAKKKVAKKVAKKKVAKKSTAAKKKTAKKITKIKVAKKTTAAKKKVAKKVANKKVAKKTTAAKKKVEKTVASKPAKKAVSQKVAEKPAKKGQTKEIEVDEQLDLELTKKEKKDIASEAREKISEGIESLNEDYSLKEIYHAIKSLEFYTSDSDECMARGCENPSTTNGYCRFHYISRWKDIKKRHRILEEGQLQEYIEKLVDKYPIKFIESLVSDLTDEKSFFAILKEMDIDADEESYDDVEEGDDDDQDIAFETKGSSKPIFED